MSENQPEQRVANVDPPWWQNGFRELGRTRYLMFAVCLVCMALTILTTWPLWQHRDSLPGPPNLPLFSIFGGTSFGAIILLSIAVSFLLPRKGLFALVGVLALAICFDQIRCQPQIFAMPVLMVACLWRPMRPVGCWYLVAMWFWAGVHKLLSPYWMGSAAWSLLDRMQLESADEIYIGFAWFVALTEIGLAVLAIAKPKFAAPFCVGLHLGIVIMLLSIHWNFSVLYWNIANAIVGAWLMWTWHSAEESWHLPKRVWQVAVVAILMLSPAGVYYGVTPHFVGHVLYSEHMPRAMMTTEDGPKEISTWESLHVPVPRTRKILRQYFTKVAVPGDKLHILDSRAALADQYFVNHHSRSGGLSGISEVDQDEFFEVQPSSDFRGVAKDYDPAIFNLQRAGVKLLKREKESMIYAVQFSPENFRADLLGDVARLLNVEQIQLAGCEIVDEDLGLLAGLPVLTGIGLDNTAVTEAGLWKLESCPLLRYVEHVGTELTEAAVHEFVNR